MKIRYTILFAFLMPLLLNAQHNIGTTYCEHNDLNASRYQPSELDFGDKKFQIGFNYDFFIGNRSIDYAELNTAFNDDQLTQEDIQTIVNESDEINQIGLGQNYQVIGLGYQLRTRSGKKYDIAFTIVDKFSATLQLSKNFLKLALEGNNSSFFRGQRVSMGETKLSALYTRAYSFNIAMPVFFKDNDHKVRIGIRPKFVQGMAGVNPESSEVFLTTEQNGEFIQMDFNYNYQTSGIQNFDPFKANGVGWGLDFGVTGFISEHFEVVASVLNLGSVTFKNNVKTYSKEGSHRFEGIFIPNLLGASPANLEFEEEASIYNPVITEDESFSMGLGARFGLELQYKTPEKPRTRRAMTMARSIKKGKERQAKQKEYEGNISNTVYFTYIQGLDEQPGNTTRPFVSIGYMHDFHDYFDIGVSAAYGGFNNLALGAFFAVNIAHHVKFGLSSDNLSAIIVPKTATGFDIATNFSVSF